MRCPQRRTLLLPAPAACPDRRPMRLPGLSGRRSSRASACWKALRPGRIAPDQASRRYGASTTSVFGARGTCEGAKEAAMRKIAADQSPDGRNGHPIRPSTAFSDHSFSGSKSQEPEAACGGCWIGCVESRSAPRTHAHLARIRFEFGSTVNFSAASSQ